MNELQGLLEANKVGMALEAHPRIAELDVDRVEELMALRDERRQLTREAAVGLVAMAKERCQALLLDEAFVEAKCERALEAHPRLGLLVLQQPG